ncbi:NUDIX domain-containing protein [Streptomyces sp. SPB074]|uniref:NUDIX domain-containing protein n=1 Tax=Streptomyces sp. (strain SPB074) TaxID=465543 RepID=UPI00017F12DD|nr:NUDIX domain-containing protein [Streptomyces sp. SPB074]EDY46790.1 MutT/nudix family protein [Streptomyces sp. SPB074]
MTIRRSAGLLVHRTTDEAGLQVLLGHMGGPLWARKDAGAWSVPKGEYTEEEAPLDAAVREFTEELGAPPPPGPYTPLGEIRQSGGKLVTVWAVPGDFDPAALRPGTFTMEWPPRSGRRQEFPELDRVGWFAPGEARAKLVKAQAAFVDRLLEHLG